MRYLIIALIFTQLSYAQPIGKVIEGKSVSSKILGKNVMYSIYLPPDYDISSSRKYPVVYLLHGYSDNETAWVQFGNVNQAADKAIANNDITPMIIVMPQGELNWYVNNYDGKVKWMDMFIKEFIPTVEKEFRARGTTEYRAISGLSMGGYGSLINCLKNPSVFSACAALSAAVWADDDIVSKNVDYENPWFPISAKGKDRLTPHWKDLSILELVNKLPLDTLKKVRWYVDCGDDDFLTTGNAKLHIVMKEKNVPHEYRVKNGYHNWDYWRTNITDALKFISAGFDRR
jgi:S-formylglutathione hydrolase FrmB